MIEDIFTSLSQSVLGAFVVIEAVALYFLHKELRSVQDKRVDDLKELGKQSQEPMRAIKQTVDLILALLQSKGIK